MKFPFVLFYLFICYGNYDRSAEKCGVNNAAIYVGEAESPKEYSKSDQCPDDRPKYEAQAHKMLKVAA